MVITPFPTFPHGGRSTKENFSPLGETGKGVIWEKWKYLDINIIRIYLFYLYCYIIDYR